MPVHSVSPHSASADAYISPVAAPAGENATQPVRDGSNLPVYPAQSLRAPGWLNVTMGTGFPVASASAEKTEADRATALTAYSTLMREEYESSTQPIYLHTSLQPTFWIASRERLVQAHLNSSALMSQSTLFLLEKINQKITDRQNFLALSDSRQRLHTPIDEVFLAKAMAIHADSSQFILHDRTQAYFDFHKSRACASKPVYWQPQDAILKQHFYQNISLNSKTDSIKTLLIVCNLASDALLDDILQSGMAMLPLNFAGHLNFVLSERLRYRQLLEVYSTVLQQGNDVAPEWLDTVSDINVFYAALLVEKPEAGQFSIALQAEEKFRDMFRPEAVGAQQTALEQNDQKQASGFSDKELFECRRKFAALENTSSVGSHAGPENYIATISYMRGNYQSMTADQFEPFVRNSDLFLLEAISCDERLSRIPGIHDVISAEFSRRTADTAELMRLNQQSTDTLHMTGEQRMAALADMDRDVLLMLLTSLLKTEPLSLAVDDIKAELMVRKEKLDAWLAAESGTVPPQITVRAPTFETQKEDAARRLTQASRRNVPRSPDANDVTAALMHDATESTLDFADGAELMGLDTDFEALLNQAIADSQSNFAMSRSTDSLQTRDVSTLFGISPPVDGTGFAPDQMISGTVMTGSGYISSMTDSMELDTDSSQIDWSQVLENDAYMAA